MQNIFFHGGFFFKSTLSILRCTWTGRINLKIFLGYQRKATVQKKNFCIFFQSTHQVGMKNVVKCYKDFFGYFNALKTHSALALDL